MIPNNKLPLKYIDEYRDARLVKELAGRIRREIRHPWTIMEICGGQTHSILKFRLEDLLPQEITLIHGPGCPVCVTPTEKIDRAIDLAGRPGVILASFGDMLRVPGSETDLLSAKAAGSDVRMVYSPLDAVKIAENNPSRQVVFFGVGFETTAPANALAVKEARNRGLKNFFLLSSQVLVPPAIRALLDEGEGRIHAFLAAGHVCTVMGYEEYIPIAETYHTPIVVTGFEPVDIMQGILHAVRLLAKKEHRVHNAYARAVKKEGNPAAKALIREIFQVTDREWRGIGFIPMSGLELSPAWAEFDAEKAFEFRVKKKHGTGKCLAGKVLQGKILPGLCPEFGKTCTPDHPLGAPMVSSEGTCAAYFRYGNYQNNRS